RSPRDAGRGRRRASHVQARCLPRGRRTPKARARMPCRCAPRSPCYARSSRASATPSVRRNAAPCAGRATTRGSARARSTTGKRRAGRPPGGARPRGRRPRRAARSGFSSPARPVGKYQSLPTKLTLHLLAAVVLERAHDAVAADGGVRAVAQLSLQPERVLVVELVEELAAERADGIELICRGVMLEQDRRERLRRRSGQHPCPGRRVVLAVLGAAVDHRGVAAARGLLGPIADEADLARRV